MRKFKLTRSITNRDNEIFRIYLKDVSRYPLINADEEKELAYKIRNGDKKSLDKLVNSNLRFVISVAKQYQGQGLDLMDLISAGNTGLIKAAHKFDPDKGYKFISYAVWWIKQAIIQAITETSRTVRLPVSQSSNILRILKTISKFEQEHDRRPSNEEIGKILDINPDKIESILGSNVKCVSVDIPFGDSEESTLIDIIPNKTIKSTDSAFENPDMEYNLKELLKELTIREHDILIMNFGLLGVQALPHDEIGKKFGLTGERVRQIVNSIIDKIKTKHLNLAKELL